MCDANRDENSFDFRRLLLLPACSIRSRPFCLFRGDSVIMLVRLRVEFM